MQSSTTTKHNVFLQFPLNHTANSSVFSTDKVASENAFRFRVDSFLESCFASSTQITSGTIYKISKKNTVNYGASCKASANQVDTEDLPTNLFCATSRKMDPGGVTIYTFFAYMHTHTYVYLYTYIYI